MFGSPATPGLRDKWAFGYEKSVDDPNYVSRKEQEEEEEEEEEAATRPMTDMGGAERDGNDEATNKAADKIWSAISLDTDILVTHTPPYGHCDLGIVRGSDDDGLSKKETGEVGEQPTRETDRHLGCYSLFKRLSVVRPRLHVCGHVHRARGAERVRWSPHPGPDYPDREDDSSSSSELAWTVSSTENWTDPSPDPKSAKISLVDLTGRGRGEANRKLAWDDSATGTGEGKRESCVVNCAILASNYPHVGGKKFHKPVVVDLELPVCNEEEREEQK